MSNEKTHKVDTIMQRDSIPMPYPVEKQLSKWEQAKMDYGGMAIGGTVALVIFAVVWLVKRIRYKI